MIGESIQHKIKRNKPPRVTITYDIETEGSRKSYELPFVIGIITFISGDSKSSAERMKFLSVDAENFSSFLAELGITLNFGVESAIEEGKKVSVNLKFSCMEDFEPLKIATSVEETSELYQQLNGLQEIYPIIDGNDSFIEALEYLMKNKDAVSKFIAELKTIVDGEKLFSLTDQEVPEGDEKFTNITYYANKCKLFISALSAEEKYNVIVALYYALISLTSPLVAKTNGNGDIYGMIKNTESTLNTHISNQIDKVIHHPSFMKLEGKVRGLYHIIHNLELGPLLKVRVLNISTEDLTKDLTKSSEFDQSQLFKMIYEEEIGTYGGFPYSLMVFDHYFGSDGASTALITELTKVCAAAHCPCVSSVAPSMFNLESMSEINNIRDMSKVLNSASKIGFTMFRKTDDSKYMTLTLPRVLARSPYSKEDNPSEGIDYTERVDPENDDVFVWINSAYVLAVRIGEAFSIYGWPAAIKGVETGGTVINLPIFNYENMNGSIQLKCPTEIALTDRREKELSDLGFTAICHCKGTNLATFFGTQTVNEPQKYDGVNATANAKITSSLQCVTVVSRIVHSIIITFRNLIGSAMTAGDIQEMLLTKYSRIVLANPVGASQELKATMPLRDFKVKIIENPSAPGCYNAIIWVAPHHFLDEITASIRSVARLPKMD